MGNSHCDVVDVKQVMRNTVETSHVHCAHKSHYGCHVITHIVTFEKQTAQETENIISVHIQ